MLIPSVPIASTRNVSESISNGAAVPFWCATTPATSGPKIHPAYFAISIFALVLEVSPSSSSRGTSAKTDGPVTLASAPSANARRNTSGKPTAKASAAATTAWTSAHQRRVWTVSRRSVSQPENGANSTWGSADTMNSSATIPAEPVRDSTRSASATMASSSPNDDRPIAAIRARRSRVRCIRIRCIEVQGYPKR